MDIQSTKLPAARKRNAAGGGAVDEQIKKLRSNDAEVSASGAKDPASPPASRAEGSASSAGDLASL